MTSMPCAVIGSGNIGTDLLIKGLRHGRALEMVAFVGVDPASEGLARAARLGIATTAGGLEGLRSMPGYADIGIIFDATSAAAHASHAPILAADGKRAIDLTPAAVGPYVVPAVNVDAHLGARNINMVTCGGQATIPIIAAIANAVPVAYAEIVASIASKSAGPGTRANIDEFTETTARAIEVVGGARRGKAIIILNPAEPPMIMRDTITCLALGDDAEAIRSEIESRVARVQEYVPGYRLKQAVQFERVTGIVVPGTSEPVDGLKVTVLLEVEGAGHYLPSYAGNLDIMTSAALAAGERMVEAILREAA
jgi:acetaldehyde dehydrogenase